MAETLHDTDLARWADEQAGALRRLAASGVSNTVDWENVIEEVESVGRSQRLAVDSLVVNAPVHLLTLHGDPASLSARKWEKEVAVFLAPASLRAIGVIRADLDLDKLWRHALERAGSELRLYERRLPPGVPAACPFGLGDLLAHTVEVDALLRTLAVERGRS